MFGIQRSPRITLFGAGQRLAVGALARDCGRRAFVCSDERIHADARLKEVLDSLLEAGLECEFYSATQPELPASCVMDAAGQARRFRPDVIIGLGGGSCLDVAKLVAAVLAHDLPLSEMYGEFKVPGPTAPVIAVPTTSGTGSEATPVAVIGDPERVLKVGISSRYLIPHAAVCDPELTLTCPPMLTAVSGADALTHAIEAFTALRREAGPNLGLDHVFVGKNTLSDANAKFAVSALMKNLPVAVREGSNLQAREQVMHGAYCAGLAFGAAGTAAAHAIQYPVGALTHTAHGLGVAVLMPYVLRFNRSHCMRELAELGATLGLAGSSDAALADAFIEAVGGLFADIGIPRSLEQLGVPADKLDWIAESALGITRLIKNNPRPIDLPAMNRLVRHAHAGDRDIEG